MALGSVMKNREGVPCFKCLVARQIWLPGQAVTIEISSMQGRKTLVTPAFERENCLAAFCQNRTGDGQSVLCEMSDQPVLLNQSRAVTQGVVMAFEKPDSAPVVAQSRDRRKGTGAVPLDWCDIVKGERSQNVSGFLLRYQGPVAFGLLAPKTELTG